MTIPLTADFDPPSREDWLALVDKTLKGGDFDKRLVSRTSDGIAVQPLYTREISAAPLHPARTPSADPARPWDLRTLVDHPDPERANALGLQDLENGAASLLLKLEPSGVDGVAVASHDDLARVLDGVLLDLAPVALDAGFMGPLAAEWLGDLTKGAPLAPLAVHLDPLGAFATAGTSPGPIEAHIARAAETAAMLQSTYPKAGLFLASGRVVHEAGGTEGQELGFMAASVVAYVRAIQAAGLERPAALAGITLGLSADADYFITIAKLRAARAIWSRLAFALGETTPARIEARSSRRMLSRLDPWVNLLRLTSAGFGAAVGGADAIQLDSFTLPLTEGGLGRPAALAQRQARNIQLVLMEESHLGRVADPAGGAWYLETLSDQLARAGWAWFQMIEAEGGALAALRSGFVATEVGAARVRREADIAKRKTGLIGVSEFANLLEDGVEVETVDPAPFARPAPDLGVSGPASTSPPLTPWRASEPFERLRAQATKRASRPNVFLATLGPLSDHAARVGFSRNLFAAGGLVADPGEAADYALAETPLAVVCGSDAAYETEAVDAVRRLKATGASEVWLAGRPAALEPALREAGVTRFIFAGCDLIETLQQALALYGTAETPMGATR